MSIVCLSQNSTGVNVNVLLGALVGGITFRITDSVTADGKNGPWSRSVQIVQGIKSVTLTLHFKKDWIVSSASKWHTPVEFERIDFRDSKHSSTETIKRVRNFVLSWCESVKIAKLPIDDIFAWAEKHIHCDDLLR